MRVRRFSCRPQRLLPTSKVVVGGLLLLVLPSLVVSSSSTLALNPSLVSTGLKNLGNTCYLNAQLQCAFHIPLIREMIMRQDILPPRTPPPQQPTTTEGEEATENPADTDEPNTIQQQQQQQQQPPPEEPVAKVALRELFLDMMQAADNQVQRFPVTPRNFCLRLGIPPMVQQDSQEFWKLLLPALHQESLSDLYKGTFEDYVFAVDGVSGGRRRDEVFLDLSLDIATSDNIMDSLLSSFGEPELLSVSEGNGWRPEKGAEKVDAMKGARLVAHGLPPILQFHLKRFNYDWQTDAMTKINNRFSFPQQLDLSELCRVAVDDDDAELTQYDLQSIVIHIGEYGAGHYYSYIRPNMASDTWYRFNDDVVEEVTLDELFADAYGGLDDRCEISSSEEDKSSKGTFMQRIKGFFFSSGSNGNKGSYGWGGKTSNAYVLQYVRRCDIPTLYQDDD